MAASAGQRVTANLFRKLLKYYLTLDDEHSLLVQSGKPVGIVRTHPQAPKVMLANSNLVPKWATWEHFNELRSEGLMMYGQMTSRQLDLYRYTRYPAGNL